jgi:hypothetical protein
MGGECKSDASADTKMNGRHLQRLHLSLHIQLRMKTKGYIQCHADAPLNSNRLQSRPSHLPASNYTSDFHVPRSTFHEPQSHPHNRLSPPRTLPLPHPPLPLNPKPNPISSTPSSLKRPTLPREAIRQPALLRTTHWFINSRNPRADDALVLFGKKYILMQ